MRETAALSGEAVRPTDRGKRRARDAYRPYANASCPHQRRDIVFAMLQKYQEVNRPVLDDEKVSMTILRKEKKPGRHEPVVEKQVTFEESIRFEEFPVLNESEGVLVLVDEVHRSHTRALHRNLRRALPNAAIIGFKTTPILSREKIDTW